VSFFGDFVARWTQQIPTKTAIHFNGLNYSYQWLDCQVLGAQQWLVSQNIKPGDRLAYLGLNHPLMLVLLFALARQGAILVPLNYRLSAREQEHQINDAQPTVIVVDKQFKNQLKAISTPQFLVETMFKDWEQTQNLTGNKVVSQLPIKGSLASDLLLVYTSGTTGQPKGAVLSQNALSFNALNSIHAHELSAQDRVLIALPMFHVGGLNIMLTPALSVGASVCIQAKFDAQAFLLALEQWRPTLSLLVPATISAVLAHPLWAQTNVSSLRLINTGSSIVPNTLLQAWHERGVPAAQVYGSTETAPIAIYLRRADTRLKVGSAGQTALHCEVKLIDQQGHECAPHCVGEIYVRGPNVMRAYWQNSQATEQAFSGDWFKTGDLAYCDNDGFFWIVGRSKEMIISGGENIYPAEIEMLVALDSHVLDCAVVGMPDDLWGEVPVLAVILKPGAGQLDEKQFLLKLLDQKLAKYKWPKYVVQVQSLPKTALGKVQKEPLREQLKTMLKRHV
jgi:fatty-acyl-CoA synthase